jgi:hypothetical protein
MTPVDGGSVLVCLDPALNTPPIEADRSFLRKS